MKRYPILWLLVLVFVPMCLSGQTHEAGGLIHLGFEQKIVKGFDFGLEAEGRFDRNFTSFDRFKLGAGFDYSFLKHKRLKIGIAANYLLYNQGSFCEHRGRVKGDITYSEKIKQFKLSYRVRVQATFYDELRGEHKFNPKTYMRNRLQFEYGFFDKPMKVYASTEFFLRLYKKGNCFIDNFRTIVGWNYKLSKGNTIGVFLRMDNEIQVANPANVYYIGFSYSFKN